MPSILFAILGLAIVPLAMINRTWFKEEGKKLGRLVFFLCFLRVMAVKVAVISVIRVSVDGNSGMTWYL